MAGAILLNPSAGCGCEPGLTCFVQVCATIGFSGAQVNFWTDASKTTLVATGTTDATGHAAITIPPGYYYREVITNTVRAVKPGDAFITITAGMVLTLTCTPGAGYPACFTGCPLPSAANLHDSHGETWAWNAGGSAGWRNIGVLAGGCELFPNLTANCGVGCTVTMASCSPGLSINYQCTGNSMNITITE